jgi:hypothetical protein
VHVQRAGWSEEKLGEAKQMDDKQTRLLKNSIKTLTPLPIENCRISLQKLGGPQGTYARDADLQGSIQNLKPILVLPSGTLSISIPTSIRSTSVAPLK